MPLPCFLHLEASLPPRPCLDMLRCAAEWLRQAQTSMSRSGKAACKGYKWLHTLRLIFINHLRIQGLDDAGCPFVINRCSGLFRRECLSSEPTTQ